MKVSVQSTESPEAVDYSLHLLQLESVTEVTRNSPNGHFPGGP